MAEQRSGDTAALVQVETAAAAAVAPVELNLYYISNKGGLDLLGTLRPCGQLPVIYPPSTFLNEGTDTFRLGPGLYLAVVAGGEIKDLAHLSPLVAEKIRMAKREEVEVGKREPTDEAKEQKSEVECKEEEEMEGDAVEQGKKAGEEEEEMEKPNKEEEEATLLSAEVRVLRGTSRAVLVLYELKAELHKAIEFDNTSSNRKKGAWIVTKAYAMNRLRNTCEDQLLALINRRAVKSRSKASFLSSDWCCGFVYKGYLSCSIETKAYLCFLGRFIGGQLLGEGSTCAVYQCFLENVPTFPFAIKKMNGYGTEEIREVEIISCLADCTVPVFYQAWVQEESDGSHFGLHRTKRYVMILMELCGRDLKDFLFDNHELKVEDKWTLFEKVARCIKYLHQSGVTHRDLKPNNFFTGPHGAIKVGDFGQSCWTKDHEQGSIDLGNPMYAAPELRFGLTTEKVDIYSLGAIYLQIFQSPENLMAALNGLCDLRAGKYDSKWITGVDVEFLKKLTSPEPLDRPRIEEILEYIGEKADGLVY